MVTITINKVRGEIDIELRDVALQESAYIIVSGEDTAQINVQLSSAQPSVGCSASDQYRLLLHQIITDYSDTGDLQNGRHICTTPIKRVNAVCEEHTISDENKIYKYNLSASSHKYPDGVLSEGGYYFDGMNMMLLLSMCVFIVIEDIHCNVGVQSRGLDQEPNDDDKITLSGLLKFNDGLWSSCGYERIIMFITNHKDSLDEALLRPGRMDVHLEMSYCTYGEFKVLSSTYLQVKEEEKLEVSHVVKYLLEKVKVTLARLLINVIKYCLLFK
ncbi:hyper-sensitivity-related 4-like protein [Tanacetum coccineum]